jgi:hypothetical protein
MFPSISFLLFFINPPLFFLNTVILKTNHFPKRTFKKI